MLRGYNLTGSPHHVIQPFGVCPEINSVLALEYFHGEELVHAIERAAHHHDDAYLFSRLTALAYFLATQHNRTANGATVDFEPVCNYFYHIIDRLRSDGRISARRNDMSVFDDQKAVFVEDRSIGRLRRIAVERQQLRAISCLSHE